MNQKESTIVQCAHCGAKNRIASARAVEAARCGKCGHPLKSGDAKTGAAEVYALRCTGCGAKNRVRSDRTDAGAKCGRCGGALKTDALFEPQPLVVTDVNFDEKVLASPLPVLLYAMSPTCPGCAQVGPVVDRFAAEARKKVRVAKLNINTSPRTADRLSIMGVPFLFIYDNGALKESLPGIGDIHDLRMLLAKYI